MIEKHQTLIRSRDLAPLLGDNGVSLSTLARWTANDNRFKRCLFKKGWYSVQLLREEKILVIPTEAPQPVETAS